LGVIAWGKEGERTVSRLVVLSFPDAKVLGALTIETGVTDPVELPGEGIVYGRNVGGKSEVRRWRMDQSAAETLFPWSDGLIQGIRVSPDGSKLLVLARDGQTANLWTCGPRGEKRTRLTDFRTGTVFQAEWAPDGKSVSFTYGSIASDVVSIRNFK
jgi:Tol biopolymer transport system component